MSKKHDNIRKKKIIIIFAFAVALLLISAIISATYFTLNSKNKELTGKNTNILYYNEADNKKNEEENVLVVGIDNESQANENKVTGQEGQNNNNDGQVGGQNNNENNNNISQKTEPSYYIKVNNQANVVTVYKKDSKGNYTTPIKAMICSIGDATPESGVYTMSDKYTWRLLEGNVYGQYACRITGHILFHSVPYTKQDKSTLEWWEYDKLGTKASLGCIRLKVSDAKWIYDNCIPGTKVEFYSDKNPGPLGKPTAQKITEDEEVRSWDPTDPDARNPWSNYLKRKEEAKEANANLENNIGNNTNNDTGNGTNNAENSNSANNDTVNNNSANNDLVDKDESNNTNTVKGKNESSSVDKNSSTIKVKET